MNSPASRPNASSARRNSVALEVTEQVNIHVASGLGVERRLQRRQLVDRGKAAGELLAGRVLGDQDRILADPGPQVGGQLVMVARYAARIPAGGGRLEVAQFVEH